MCEKVVMRYTWKARLIYWALAFCCLQAADAAATTLLLHRVDGRELNPIAVSVLHGGGFEGVVVYKVAITAIAIGGAYVIFRYAPRFWVTRAFPWLTVGIVAIVDLWNILQLAHF